MNFNILPATEFAFILPIGSLDSAGNLHRQGVMRLATGKDEIFIKNDRRVRENPAYAVILVLNRVITHLGTLATVPPELLEQLFLIDLVYLRDFYNQINQRAIARLTIEGSIAREGVGSQGTIAYPLEQLYQEVAAIAFHFHWSLDEILNLEHQERQRWIAAIESLKR